MNLSKEAIKLLQKYWGYTQFRDDQAEVIDSVLDQKDTLAILPTGAGKSICYQIPGLMYKGTSLIISPLIALMQDQVISLKERGIKAELLHSGQNYRQQDIILDNAIYGDIKLLFMSPEKTQSKLFISRFKKMLCNFIAIDEAHCISEWGHDFRPEYRLLAQLREIKPKATFLAVTATATPKVMDDIIQSLELKKPQLIHRSPVRSNLQYCCIDTEDKINYLKQSINLESSFKIIYTNRRKSADYLHSNLKSSKTETAIYHGGLSRKIKAKSLDRWLSNDPLTMIATKAFGMGIDKQNVRSVFHAEIPNSLEAYVQEAGRAGRDKKKANCILLFNQGDLKRILQEQKHFFPSIELIKQIYSKIAIDLNIASGRIPEEIHPFDIYKFCKKHQYKISIVSNALKLLHQQEIIYVSEPLRKPSTLSLDEEATKVFLKRKDVSTKMNAFITLTLRLYDGLFISPQRINEKLIANKFDTTSQKVTKALNWLHKAGIAEYKSSYEGQTLSFENYRYSKNELPLDQFKYNEKKQKYIDDQQVLIDYIGTQECRQIFIAKHFGFNAQDCHNCDNCVKKHFNKKKKLEEDIDYIIAQEPISIQSLLIHFHPGLKDHISNILRYKIDDNEIHFVHNLIHPKD